MARGNGTEASKTHVEGDTPRRRGRRPGSPKVPGSGRQKGAGNKLRADLKEVVLARGKPLELLCDIARGLRIRVGPQAGPGSPEYAYPSLDQRIGAARTLLAKILPDLKAQEIVAEVDQHIESVGDVDVPALAQRIHGFLGLAGAARDGDPAPPATAARPAFSHDNSLETPESAKGSQPTSPVSDTAPADMRAHGAPETQETASTPKEPSVPRVGEVVHFSNSTVAILALEGDRVGLPTIYECRSPYHNARAPGTLEARGPFTTCMKVARKAMGIADGEPLPRWHVSRAPAVDTAAGAWGGPPSGAAWP